MGTSVRCTFQAIAFYSPILWNWSYSCDRHEDFIFLLKSIGNRIQGGPLWCHNGCLLISCIIRPSDVFLNCMACLRQLHLWYPFAVVKEVVTQIIHSGKACSFFQNSNYVCFGIGIIIVGRPIFAGAITFQVNHQIRFKCCLLCPHLAC